MVVIMKVPKHIREHLRLNRELNTRADSNLEQVENWLKENKFDLEEDESINEFLAYCGNIADGYDESDLIEYLENYEEEK